MARAALAVGIEYGALVGLLVRYALRRRSSGTVAVRSAARTGGRRRL
jgi:hypothetical protein